MKTIRARLEQLREDRERGNLSVFVIGTVVIMVVVAGLVFDSYGKYQTSQEAYMVAASAARAGTNALSGQAVVDGSLALDKNRARAAAQSYLTAAGIPGTVTVIGDTITVSVDDEYRTKYLSLIAINSLPVKATASARIITQ